MHTPTAFGCIACAAALTAGAARAAFVPLSAVRTTFANSPAHTSTTFGPFDGEVSGMETGNGGFVATGSVTQHSNIGDGSASPVVSFNGVTEWTAVGGPSNHYLEMVNSFTLTFQLTSPATLEHTFVSPAGGFDCSLAPAGGGLSVSLLAPGMNDIALAAGSYTLSIDGSADIYYFRSPGSAHSTLIGTLSFIPAPHPALAIFVPALLTGRRRRRG